MMTMEKVVSKTRILNTILSVAICHRNRVDVFVYLCCCCCSAHLRNYCNNKPPYINTMFSRRKCVKIVILKRLFPLEQKFAHTKIQSSLNERFLNYHSVEERYFTKLKRPRYRSICTRHFHRPILPWCTKIVFYGLEIFIGAETTAHQVNEMTFHW